MKIVSSLRQLFILVLLCLFQVSGTHAEPIRLKMALEHWPPYVDRNVPEHGVATEIVVTALERAGYQVVKSFDTWSNTLQGTGLGVFDVIATAWFTDERDRLFAYSKPYLYNKIKFIKRKGSSQTFNSFDDLRGVLIGTVRQYAYSGEFDNNQLLIKLPVNHLIQNLSLLQLGNIGLTLDDELVIRHQIETYMPGTADQFELLEKPLATRGLHMLVSRAHPKHQAIVASFDQAIAEMKSDGSFDDIIRKYENGYRFHTEKD